MFISGLKSSEVELWEILYSTKGKIDHKVFIFGFNSSILRTHVKYNINKNVKAIVSVRLCNEHDV